MGLEDADRLARLDQERLVILQLAQRSDDSVETLPIARCLAGAAIDDQVLRPFRYLFVEVVVQHAQRRLLLPALARDLAAARRLERSVPPNGDIGNSRHYNNVK